MRPSPTTQTKAASAPHHLLTRYPVLSSLHHLHWLYVVYLLSSLECHVQRQRGCVRAIHGCIPACHRLGSQKRALNEWIAPLMYMVSVYLMLLHILTIDLDFCLSIHTIPKAGVCCLTLSVVGIDFNSLLSLLFDSGPCVAWKQDFLINKQVRGPLPSDNYNSNFIGLRADNSLFVPRFSKCLLSPITFLQAAISKRESCSLRKQFNYASKILHIFLATSKPNSAYINTRM